MYNKSVCVSDRERESVRMKGSERKCVGWVGVRGTAGAHVLTECSLQDSSICEINNIDDVVGFRLNAYSLFSLNVLQLKSLL